MTGPVYLLASERSGTNLLRQRLADHQLTLCSVPPVHILRTLGYWTPVMGPLRDDDKWRDMINYALRCCYERPVPWAIELCVDSVFQSYDQAFGKDRTLIKLTHHLYSLYAEKQGYESYFCKDIWLFDFAHEIKDEIPDAKFIHLYRDPRDYVVSQRQRPFGIQSVNRLAKQWAHECGESLRVSHAFRIKNEILSFSYESFIQDEEKYISLIIDEFSLQEGMSNNEKEEFDFHEWKNIHKKTKKDNYNRYKKHLSSSQIEMIEGICWPLMKYLGYSTENNTRPKILYPRLFLESLLSGVSVYLRRKYHTYIKKDSINRKVAHPLIRELEERFR